MACRPDRVVPAPKVNDSILRGDFIVKVLRVPTGTHLGPGVYEVESSNFATGQRSHNIRSEVLFPRCAQQSRRGSKHGPRHERAITSVSESGALSLSSIFKSASPVQTPHKRLSTPESSEPEVRTMSRPQSPVAETAKGPRYNVSLGESDSPVCNVTSSTVH